MDASLIERFHQAVPAVDFCSLRYVRERSEYLDVRQDVLQPVATSEDSGVMLTVYDGGGMGYCATSDLSLSGLRQAAAQARDWARLSAGQSVVDTSRLIVAPPHGAYSSTELRPWASVPLSEKLDLLRDECARLKTDERIVDWEASLWYTAMDTLYLTADGGQVEQRFRYLVPMLSATANTGAETQTRSFGGRGYCRQGGLEILEHVGFRSAAPRIAEEALQLLTASNCPSGTMDVLLAPDQVILQVHESIGHPLELDRRGAIEFHGWPIDSWTCKITWSGASRTSIVPDGQFGAVSNCTLLRRCGGQRYGNQPVTNLQASLTAVARPPKLRVCVSAPVLAVALSMGTR